MRSIEQITQEVLSLPNVSRVQLAKKLVESLDVETEPTIPSPWVNDITRRTDAAPNNVLQNISGEEALAEVLHRLISSNDQT
jgi:Putative addiction module component